MEKFKRKKKGIQEFLLRKKIRKKGNNADRNTVRFVVVVKELTSRVRASRLKNSRLALVSPPRRLDRVSEAEKYLTPFEETWTESV